MSKLHTIKDLARASVYSEARVFQLIQAGIIPGQDITGGRYSYFSEERFQESLERLSEHWAAKHPTLGTGQTSGERFEARVQAEVRRRLQTILASLEG